MLDLKLNQDGGTGEFDLSIAPGGDFETVNDLSTALLVALLTDARAGSDQVVTPERRSGWIGNAVPPIEGFELGSLLWLVDTAKATQGTMTIAASLARDALQWLLDQGIADDVQVEGEITGPGEGGLTITVTSPDGTVETQYIDLWRRTEFLPGVLPPPIVDEAPFSPLSLADLIVWGDAVFSEHNQGNTSTINGNASLFFDGTGERMRDSSPTVTSPPGTLAAVFTPTSVAATGDADVVRLRLGFDAVMRIYRNGDDLIGKEGQGGSSTELAIANTLVADETRWAIFRARNSGDGASDLLDDAANSDSASLAAAIDDIDDINIAANADGTNDWTGHIHEIVYYNRFLTDTERTDLANYFNNKWSL